MFILRNIKASFKVYHLRASGVYFSTSINYKEKRINVGNYSINYLKVGNGTHNVLCMPGALGSIWTDFNPQLEGFDREKFSVIAWDLPGYGKSRPPEREFPPDFNEKDADFAYDFIKTLNIPKLSLLGYSDGGITSMIFAAKYPEVVQKLVIWGTHSFILPSEHETLKKIKDTTAWSKNVRKLFEAVYGKELFLKLWTKYVDVLINIYYAKNGNLCAHLLKDIVCPTLILYGEKDPLVDSAHVTHLHTHIQGARIHLYPEGKHSIHIKYAEDFNKRIQEFLLEG